MITLTIDGKTQQVAAQDGVLVLENYVTPGVTAIEVAIAGDQPVTVVDTITSSEPLTCTIVSAQQAPVRYEWRVADQGPQAERTVIADCVHAGSAITIQCRQKTAGNQRIVLRTDQRHTASHTSSEVSIHGVSDDRSRMDVQSMIHIAQDIVGVQAHQVHRHLLLSSGARATSEPMLEVLSDDVKCSHGAAISHLDSQQIFYLQSRGFSKKDARETLVNAFLAA